MSRSIRNILLLGLVVFAASATVFAQRRGGGFVRSAPRSYSARAYGYYGGYGYGYYAPYPAYAYSFYGQPNYWWVSHYPSEDPRQAGYNPNSGYEWDSVGALILATNPPTARVTLDGIYAGTTDKLGPFQLPVGEHTLHIEAPGFEPSDTVVRFDKPGVESLEVDLKRLTAFAKPGPRP